MFRLRRCKKLSPAHLLPPYIPSVLDSFGNYFRPIFVFYDDGKKFRRSATNHLTSVGDMSPATSFRGRPVLTGCVRSYGSMQAHGMRALKDSSKPYLASLTTPWLLNLS